MYVPKWAVWPKNDEKRQQLVQSARSTLAKRRDQETMARAIFAAGAVAAAPGWELTARQLVQEAGQSPVDPRYMVPVTDQQRQLLVNEAFRTPEFGLRSWAAGVLGHAPGWELTAKQLVAQPGQPPKSGAILPLAALGTVGYLLFK